jgi:hypothetical protein
MKNKKSLDEVIANSKYLYVFEYGIKIGHDHDGSYLIVFANKDKVRVRKLKTFTAVLTNLDTNTKEDIVSSDQEEWHLPKSSHYSLEIEHIIEHHFIFTKQTNNFHVVLELKPIE